MTTTVTQQQMQDAAMELAHATTHPQMVVLLRKEEEGTLTPTEDALLTALEKCTAYAELWIQKAAENKAELEEIKGKLR